MGTTSTASRQLSVCSTRAQSVLSYRTPHLPANPSGKESLPIGHSGEQSASPSDTQECNQPPHRTLRKAVSLHIGHSGVQSASPSDTQESSQPPHRTLRRAVSLHIGHSGEQSASPSDTQACIQPPHRTLRRAFSLPTLLSNHK